MRQLPRCLNKVGHTVQRATACFLIFSFLLTLLTIPPAQAVLVPESVSTGSWLSFEQASTLLPEKWGQVQEEYSSGTSPYRVILIQDAHALPEAQANIENLIQYFYEKFGVSLVLLEGASVPLDPQIFRSFPDKEMLRNVFQSYQQQGELTGGTSAAIFSDQGIDYEGAEDWGLYEEGLRIYLESMKNEKGAVRILRAQRKELTERKKKIYSPKLFAADRALDRFEENKLDLAEVLKTFAAIQPPPENSELELVLKEIQDAQAELFARETEVRGAADKLRVYLGASPRFKQDLQRLNQQFQEFQVSGISAETFVLFLEETAEKCGLDLTLSQSLRNAAKQQRKMRDIQGTRFFKDFEEYTQSVKEGLFSGDQEKELDRESRRLRLLNRLAHLELSYSDWEEVRKMAPEPSESLSLRSQRSFYENAQKREGVFFNKLIPEMKRHRSETAIFVAGGFHAGGLTRQLKESGISYTLVTPEIGSVPEDNPYRRHMKGDVSWRNYFKAENGKVSLYKAFVRASRDHLMQESREPFVMLKQWRDQIIRDLAGRGEIAKAREYTRFIDETTKEHADRLRQQWTLNVENFLDHLRELKGRGQLNEKNILALLQPSLIVATEAAVLASHDQVATALLPSSQLGSVFPTEVSAGRSEVRNSLIQQIDVDPQTAVMNTSKEEVVEKVLMPLLLETGIDEKWGIGIANAYLDAIGLVFVNGSEVVKYFYDVLGRSEQKAILQPRVQKMLQRRLERASDNKDPVYARQVVGVVPAFIYLRPEWRVQDLYRQTLSRIKTRPKISSNTEIVKLTQGIIHVEMNSDLTYGKDHFFVIKGDQEDFIYFPARQELLPLRDGHARGVFRFEESKERLFSEPSPLLYVEKQGDRIAFRVTGYLNTVRITPDGGKDLRASAPENRADKAEEISRIFNSEQTRQEALARSEVRSADALVSSVGFFPGFESWKDYLSLGNTLYETEIPEVRKVYLEAAKALGFEHEDGTPDPTPIFSIDFSAADKEVNGLLAAAMITHNLALHAYYQAMAGQDAPLTKTNFIAYTGENFGILTAAIAAGGISLSDGIKLAKEFTPCLKSCESSEEYQVYSISSKHLPAVLKILRERLNEDIEIRQTFSEGSTQRVEVYVAKSKGPLFLEHMLATPKDTKVWAEGRPTRLAMHSRKMKAARDRLDEFVNEQRIEFNDPKVPIISNNNVGVIRTAANLAQAIFGIIDEPMNSKETARLMDEANADFFVQMGMGERGQTLADENYLATPFLTVDNNLLDEKFFKTLKTQSVLRETAESLRDGKISELTEEHYRILRSVFHDIDGDDFSKKMLFRFIANTVRAEMLGDHARHRPEVFYRFMEILQNTYLAQVVLNMSVISSDTLVLSLIFKKKLDSTANMAAPPVDIELLTYDRKGREVELSFPNYRYLESITYSFGQLPLTFEELAYRTQQLIETQPLAKEIYDNIRVSMELPDIKYFTDSSTAQDQYRNAIALIAYQYAMFEVLKLHKPALFGQNFYYVTATDDIGMTVAMAASEALSIGEAIAFYRGLLLERLGEKKFRDLAAKQKFKEPAIKIYDPQSQGLVRRADQLPDLLSSFLERSEPDKPLSLSYESRIITFDSQKSLRVSDGVDPDNVIHIEGLYDVWQRHANPQLDMLEDLSILRLTDQNGKVYRFAEGIGTTTANVYAYINAGEEVLDFFKGGSGSLTMKLKTREGKIIVRKVLSERFTAHWEGTGVMMGQHTKALAQTDYLQNLPPELAELFPKVLRVQQRDLPIPPSNPDFDKYRGVYHELIYDMEFMPGMDVSDFVRVHQPPPAVVARLDAEIFRVLRQKIHVHRAAVPAAEETLEESYLTKIEKRLALTQKELPHVFNADILEPDTIEIDGEVYRNIRPILHTLRTHPEYLKILEPRVHSLVIGDTNTENIRITHQRPIMDAMSRGDQYLNFTAEEIGIKFFDPRSIGFRTQGGATVDDRMYDNKPFHNITMRDGNRRLGNYDEIHGEYFDVKVRPSAKGSAIDVAFHEDSPYAASYAGMETYFKQILSDAWDIDNPDSEFVKQDPYWLIRLVFLMGTHFAAMPPFHVTKEIDGSKIDDYEHQKRPIAIYAEGIKWLNIALDMLEQNRTDFLGVQVPPLPFTKHESTAPAQPTKVQRSEVRHLNGPEDMSHEARLFFSPWSRLARGTGLGPHTMDYDAKIAGQIRRSFEVVSEKVPETHAYNQFSRLLVELILDVETPGRLLQRAELEERTEKILTALGQETGAYQYATAAAILMDAYAKLELDAGLLINGKHDLAKLVLDKIETIPFKNDGIYGYYERVTAYTSLFISMGQLGIADRLVTSDKNYINMALEQLETIPSPWNRGRGSSMLFAALKVLGYERFLWEGGKDYIKDTLDYIDRAEELNIWPSFPAAPMSHAYFTIEPYLTTLNALSILGHPEYLNYKMDRIAKVNQMMQQLSPEETALIGEYYLLTLYNLGVLEDVIPDLDGYLRNFAGLMETIKPAPLWFPNGVAYPYAMETLWFFGRSELISDDMVDRMDNSLTEFTDAKDVTNWGHPLSYILNTHAQLGTLDRIFEPQPQDNPAYGQAPVMEWGIRHFAGDTAGFQKSLPMFDHTLISLALRMRGRDRNESNVYAKVKFAGGRSEVRQEQPRPLTSRTPGTFGYKNMLKVWKDLAKVTASKRIAEIAEEVEAGGPIRRAQDYAGRPLTPAEVEAGTVFDSLLSPHYGQPWYGVNAPEINYFVMVDYAIYLTSLLAGHFQDGTDPYAKANQERISMAADFLKAKNDSADIETLPTEEALGHLVKNVLYGNKFEGTVEYAEAFRIANDGTADMVRALQNVGPQGTLDIFVDNSGPEFAANLQLAAYLLEKNIAGNIRIHIKSYPYSISDVWGRKDDVMQPHIARVLDLLSTSGDPRIAQVSERIQKFIGKRLTFEREDFIAHTADFGLAAEKLKAVTQDSKLVIFVGDFLYMKLFGNREWPHTEDPAVLARMLPAIGKPVGIIRMVKAPLKWGVPADSAENNTVGMIRVIPGTESGLLKMTKEASVSVNTWNRLSRGIGVGMFPTDYSERMAENIREATQLLDRIVPSSNSYNKFSNLLTRFILDAEKPGADFALSDEFRMRIEEITAALKEIKGPLLYVNASAVLFEAFAKIGVGAAWLVNDDRDLVKDALEMVEKIQIGENTTSGAAKAQTRGNYDQLISFAQLFTALGHLGVQKRLLASAGEGQGNYIEKALAITEDIPSPFARGRYAPVLFMALKSIGYADYIFKNQANKDYLAGLLDYTENEKNIEIDAGLSVYKSGSATNAVSPEYRRAYPLMLTLMAIGALGKKEYVNYNGRDRLAEAREVLGRLTEKTPKGIAGDDVAKHVILYLTALSNLGELTNQVSDLTGFIKGYIPEIFEEITDHSGYAFELLWLAGLENLIPKDAVSKWINLLDIRDVTEMKRYPVYSAAYTLTALGQMGHDQAAPLFEVNPAFANKAPFLKFLEDLAAHPKGTDQFLGMIHHALINYALRMRGADKQPQLFEAKTPATLPILRQPIPTVRRGEEPTFLLKGATLSEQEDYLRREFAKTPLQRDVPGRGPFITNITLDRAKSTASHFYAVMQTSMGQTIELKFGSQNPSADEVVIRPFFIKWGYENSQLKQLQAAYGIGHLPSDILLTMLKILKDSGASMIAEPLGIPGSDKFFDRALGVTFQKYHTAPADQVYSIQATGYNVEDEAGNWIPVKMLLVHFSNLKFPEALWPEDAAASKAAKAASVVWHSKADILAEIRSKKLSAGMHIADIQGKSPDEIVDLGRQYEAHGIYPEIGASEAGIDAIRIYREHNPDSLIAAGEIEENGVERPLAAVRAGADILVALENPISGEVIDAVRALNPNVVIIASAKTEAEAEFSIRAGVDGIKIRPFALPQERIPESLALLRTLRHNHPELLLGGSRGIQPEQLPELIDAGLEFVGLGVQSAIEGSQILVRQAATDKRVKMDGPAEQSIARLFEAAHELLLSETPLSAGDLSAEDLKTAQDLADQSLINPLTSETPARELFENLKESYLRLAAKNLPADQSLELSRALGAGTLNFAQRLPILEKYFVPERADFINQLLIVPFWASKFQNFLDGNVREIGPVKSYRDLPRELRTVHSPWMRFARGMGLGAESLGYDAETERNILSILDSLDAKVPDNQAYHQFSKLLVRLILDVNHPGRRLQPAQLQLRIGAIMGALDLEKNAYDYAVGASILVDTAVKIGLDASLLTQARPDFISKVLATIESIPPKKDGGAGFYERVSAYGTFFLALGHSALKTELTADNASVFQKSLDLLAEIPAPWNRGRAAAVLFTGLKAVGEEKRVFAPGQHDYIKETFDALDRGDESYSGLSKDFFKIFPLLTMLNAVAAMDEPSLAADYKSYKMDRIAQARSLMENLSPIEKMLMTQYYLMALANLGELERTIPDLQGYLKSFASLTDQVQPEGNWFPNGVALAYAAETLWFFGQADLIPESLIQRIMTALPTNYADAKFAVNRDNPMAYVFNAFEELGITQKTFFTAPAGGRKPIEALIESLTGQETVLQKGIYALDHALINSALRRRSEVRGIATDRNLDPESRMFGNGWIRMSQGAALGIPAMNYDPKAAGYLRQMLTILDQKVPADDTYNHFSSLLSKFILDVVNPDLVLSEESIQSRTAEIIKGLQSIESSLLYVNASAILFETFGKLGLDTRLLVNERQDLVRDALMRVEKITSAENTTTPAARNKVRGPYDQLIAYQQLFQAMGQLKLQGRLMETLSDGRNYVEHALGLIEQIPSAFARGRYAPVLFITLKNIGYEKFIFENAQGRDYMKELLDYMDHPGAFERIPGSSPLYSETYALFLTLSAIGVLGRPEYLNYKRDRADQARDFIRREQLEPSDEAGKQTMLYLLTLSNLGILNSEIPDLDAYLESWLKLAMEAKDLPSDPLYAGRNLGYTLEIVHMLGRRDLITPEMLTRWVEYLNTEKYPIKGRTYPYNAAFILTVLGELGEASRLFSPHPGFGGKMPLPAFLDDFLADSREVEMYLPFINHAILNYSLRMRGTRRSEVRSNVGLNPDPVLKQTPGTQPVTLAGVIEASGMSGRIRPDDVYLIPPSTQDKARLITEINGAIAQWVAEKNQRGTRNGSFSESELQELIEALVQKHRPSMEALVQEFDDDEAFPGNASVGLGGRMGQPTIFLNSWKKGKPSRTHDHGESKAAYHVLRGKLKETTYIPAPGGGFTRSEQLLQEGSTLSMSPPYIHQVENGNENNARTISINAYAPQLVLMNRYQLKEDGLVFTDQWVDDEVVHEVLTSHTPEGRLSIGIEIGAIQDWQKDENHYPGYTRNALAMTLLFTLLEDEGLLKPDLIKKGYSLEAVNRLYLSGLEGEAIFRKIQNASRNALQRDKSEELKSFEQLSAATQELRLPAQEEVSGAEDGVAAIDAVLEVLRPSALLRSELRETQSPLVLEVPGLVIKMGVDEFAGMALNRLNSKLQELETEPETELVDPRAAKAALTEIRNILQGLMDEKYTMGYVAADDNRSFVDGIKQLGALIERLIVYSEEGKVSPEFSSALRNKGIVYTLERGLGRRSRTAALALGGSQKFIGVVMPGDLHFDAATQQVLIPIRRNVNAKDPLLDTVGMTLQAAVALLLAREATDLRRKNYLLLHPEEILKKYQLFTGFENQILRFDGEQGFIISSQAIQAYLADRAIKQSA